MSRSVDLKNIVFVEKGFSKLLWLTAALIVCFRTRRIVKRYEKYEGLR